MLTASSDRSIIFRSRPSIGEFWRAAASSSSSVAVNSFGFTSSGRPTGVPTARFRMLLISALRLLRSCSSFTSRVSRMLVWVWALNTSCLRRVPTAACFWWFANITNRDRAQRRLLSKGGRFREFEHQALSLLGSFDRSGRVADRRGQDRSSTQQEGTCLLGVPEQYRGRPGRRGHHRC